MSDSIFFTDSKQVATASLPPSIGFPERVIPMQPLYSGGKCYVPQDDVPAIIDIETLRFDNNPPNLVNHDPSAVAGTLVNVRKEIVDGIPQIFCDAKIKGTIFAKLVADYFDEEIHELKPSIGVGRDTEYTKEVYGRGQTVAVNNQVFEGPCVVHRNSCLTEGSWVSIHGDEGARAALSAALKSAYSNKRKEGDPMDFNLWLEEVKGMSGEEIAALTDEEKAALEEEFKNSEEAATAEIGDSESTGGGDDLKEAAIEEINAELQAMPTEEVLDEYIALKSEGEFEDESPSGLTAGMKKKRASANREILTAGLRHKAAAKDNRRIEAIKVLCGDQKDVAARAIEEGWGRDKTEKVLTARMGRKNMENKLGNFVPNRAHQKHDGPTKQEVLTASLAMTVGLPPEKIKAVLGYSDDVLTAAMSVKSRGATIRSVIAESANSFRPGSVDFSTSQYEAYKTAMAFCRDLDTRRKVDPNAVATAAMGFSTVVATDAIFDTLKVSLLQQPDDAEHMYSQLVEQNVVSDFNEEKGYDGAIIGRLRPISSTGQIEHVTFEEGVVSYGTELQATTITLPEKLFWQDSIGFFADIIKQFQALPEKSVEHDVAEMFWKILNGEILSQDGKPFFSAERGNLLSGADTILSGSGLSYAEMAMDDFKAKNGNPLSSAGAFLLINSAQAATARRLYSSEKINVEDTIGTDNIYQGTYPPVKWQYLNRNFVPTDNTFFQNYGSSFWMMMRAPSVRPLVAVTRLANFQSPIFEQKESNPSVYGRVYRIIYPYRVNPMYGDAAVLSLGKEAV